MCIFCHAILLYVMPKSQICSAIVTTALYIRAFAILLLIVGNLQLQRLSCLPVAYRLYHVLCQPVNRLKHWNGHPQTPTHAHIFLFKSTYPLGSKIGLNFCLLWEPNSGRPNHSLISIALTSMITRSGLYTWQFNLIRVTDAQISGYFAPTPVSKIILPILLS